jgi:hypothetical protein
MQHLHLKIRRTSVRQYALNVNDRPASFDSEILTGNPEGSFPLAP